MKRLAVLSALVLVTGNLAKAGDLENLRNASGDALSSIQDSVEALTKAPPKPGFNPGHNPGYNPGHNPGHTPGHNPGWNPPPPQPHHPPQPPQPWNPGPWNPHPVPPPPPPQPWHPQPGPWNPAPWPPIPPAPHYDRVDFQSGRFDWSNDARRSFDEAVEALRRANVFILEKRLDYSSYRLVFETRRYARVERYDSMIYTWSGDAQRAADEMARSYAYRGYIVLEKNVRRTSFTISYFDPR